MNNTNPSIVDTSSIGAIIFIIVVLLWYSSSFIVLLGMQIGVTSNDVLDDSIQPPSKLFVQTLRDQTNNKEILEELVDKQKRDKLWDIYLGTSTDKNDKISRDEIHRIRNIKKQLSVFYNDREDDNQRIFDDSYISHSNSSLWSTITDGTSSNSRIRVRRRSSSDNRILKEWKTLGDTIKVHEHLPWAIQKLFIRRHLKRHRRASECPSEPISSSYSH